MDKLEHMRVFMKVAQSGSFIAASRELNMTAPSVTRSVAKLEDRLGVRLLTRTTRKVRLTDAGARYLEDVRQIFEAIEAADKAAAGSHGEPRGTLSVTAPVLFGQKFVMPQLTAYLQAFPRVDARVLLVDRVVNLLEEGLDVGVRLGPLPDSRLYAAQVGTIRRLVCASPYYLEKNGTPRRPEELKEHNTIHATGPGMGTLWRFEGGISVKLAPKLDCNQNAPAIAAACEGFGIARLMSYQVSEEIASGDLVPLLEDFEGPPLPVHVVHLEGRKAQARVRGFVDQLVGVLRVDPRINDGQVPVPKL